VTDRHPVLLRTLLPALAVIAAISATTTARRDGLPPSAAGLFECFLFQQVGVADVEVVNPDECFRRSAPASTFKIPHAVIALDAGVVRPDEVLPWAKNGQPFDSWKRDHTVESAIRFSVLWFFQQTAARLGRERMLSGLRTVEYGDAAFTGDLTAFWIDGGLTVTPHQQLDFLRRLFTGEVRVARAHLDTVKAALVMPRGKISNAAGIHDFPLAWPEDTIVRAKTGNTRDGKGRVSWLVGGLATGGREYVFVGRVRSAEAPLVTTAGAEAGLRHLNRRAPSGPARF